MSYDVEERIYHKGFRDGWMAAIQNMSTGDLRYSDFRQAAELRGTGWNELQRTVKPKKGRKLSDWNKFVKANSKKKQFRYASGKVNLKKLGVAYRKKKRGR